MHVRQSVIAALEAVGELRVIEAQEVQDGRLQVVDVDFVLGDEVAEFVRRAVGHAGLHAAAGHEHGEAVRIVVAAQVGGAVAFFVERRASELAAPDDERLVAAGRAA